MDLDDATVAFEPRDTEKDAHSSLKPLRAYVLGILNPDLKQADKMEVVGYVEQLIASREAGAFSFERL